MVCHFSALVLICLLNSVVSLPSFVLVFSVSNFVISLSESVSRFCSLALTVLSNNSHDLPKVPARNVPHHGIFMIGIDHKSFHPVFITLSQILLVI